LVQQSKRVALVTGGSRGIGLGIAEQLAHSGFDLAINDVHDVATVAAATTLLEERGADVLYVPGNSVQPADRMAMIEAIRNRFDRLDVLVNNSGVSLEAEADILDATEESFDRMIDVDLKGPYFLTQQVAHWMAEQHRANGGFTGTIVNVSSISATDPAGPQTANCISKPGTTMATQLWAQRLAEFGVSVYEIRTGAIHLEGEAGSAACNLAVEQRPGTAADIGRAVAVLARGELTYATGNVINIDGGLTLRRL
jgi:3-oxoacyl-[acyl-carrier protein] reductase